MFRVIRFLWAHVLRPIRPENTEWKESWHILHRNRPRYSEFPTFPLSFARISAIGTPPPRPVARQGGQGDGPTSGRMKETRSGGDRMLESARFECIRQPSGWDGWLNIFTFLCDWWLWWLIYDWVGDVLPGPLSRTRSVNTCAHTVKAQVVKRTGFECRHTHLHAYVYIHKYVSIAVCI